MMTKQVRLLIAGFTATAVTLTACSGAAGPDGSPAPSPTAGAGIRTELLVGGGAEDPLDGPTAGATVGLDRDVTALEAEGDGTVWGLLGGDRLVKVEPDGTTTAWSYASTAGLTGASDLALGPDGEVYLAARTDGEPGASIYRFTEQSGVEPFLGRRPAEPDADVTRAGPDGVAADTAELNAVNDVDVTDDGTLTFVEYAGSQDNRSYHRVRAVVDGRIETVAGRTRDAAVDLRPVTDALRDEAAVVATEVDLEGAVGLGSGPEGLVLQLDRSVVAVDADDIMQPVLGFGRQHALPATPDTGPFTAPVPAVDSAMISPPGVGPAVSDDGSMLVRVRARSDEQPTGAAARAFAPEAPDASEQAQRIIAESMSFLAWLLVTPEGMVVTAGFADGAVLDRTGNMVAALTVPDTGETVLVRYPVPAEIR